MSNIRAHSDPIHQHFGPSLPGHQLQNSYTQTGSFHVINEGLLTNNSTLNSSLHHMVCTSAMDCESPVTSTTGLALTYHNSRFPAKTWAPITPQKSLQSPPNSLQSPPLYHHSTHPSHHMRLNNVSHANGSPGSNSQHSSHHSRTGPAVAQQTFRREQNRHVNHSSQHTPQHTSTIGSIGKSHPHLAHSAPSLQVAAISSSCPTASSTSSHPSTALVLDALTQSLQKSNSMTSPPSSISSDFSVPMDTSAGQIIPAFIQNTPTFQSIPPFQAPYQTSGQSLFMATNFQLKSNPNATVSPKHSLFQQVICPGSPAISSSTLNQQQRQTGLVESVLKRSRQSYASEEADRDDMSPMVHDLLPTAQHTIGRQQH